MDEQTEALNELSEAYLALDIEHQNTLIELEKYKESNKYGATFQFGNGQTLFIPVFGLVRNLSLGGNKPVSYTLNFNESTMVEWIYNADIAIEKISKQPTPPKMYD